LNQVKTISLPLHLKDILLQTEKTGFSENEIIQGCISEKEQFQEILYKKYSGTVFGICMRYLKNRDEALDQMHDCFIKIFISLPTFRFEASLKTWISRVTINHVLQQLTKNSKVSFTDDVYKLKIPEELPEESDLFLENFSISSEKLLSMVQEMPDGYRTVLNLFAIEKYTHKEIATLLGISENTSKTQLFKARNYLKNKLRILKTNGSTR
jgi:RNA polymerase sigma factor (sigma-70 family)